eukprot:CAMPEP_0177656858 /NCGR_PEP_ID=MMETSP0447-20121125/15829_1 /TAXON_ID=0 /ORGANISM="Stygamoeba regulata, Strain BSH-02190019" /LENGTH=134 /DNA_ID=CAMNT_0019161081 /DNA_START=534 /DNA_END=935 /DNA_ORIENTATION=+
MRHLEIGKLVKEQELHSGFDEKWNSYTLDEDKVCDALETQMCEGGNVVDHHGCDFFPLRWFDLIVVLRADNTKIFDRLSKRGYTKEKINENVEAEIFQVCLDEAMESYPAEKIIVMNSNGADELEANVAKLEQW